MNIWDTLTAEDETPLDANLLAAYAEGRLGDVERARVRKLIHRSPRSMEILDALRAEFPAAAVEPQPLPFAAATRPSSAAAAGWRRAVQPLLTAAALLVAAGITYLAVRDSGDPTGNLASGESVQAKLERLYALRPEEVAVVALRRTPGLAAAAFLMRDEMPRGPGDELPAEDQAARQQAAQQIVDEATGAVSGGTASAPALLDLAAVQIAAGRVAEAEALIDRAEQLEGRSAVSLNLRAARLMTIAYNADDDETQTQLWQEASRLLDEAIKLDETYALAYFNRALLEEDRDGDAASWWQRYVNIEQDEAMRAVVEQFRQTVPTRTPTP